MTLQPISAFTDNYIWMVHDGQRALVVDPGDAGPVLEVLDREGLKLEAILVTHHHVDHVGGIAGLRDRLRGPIYGPAHERIPEPYQAVEAPCFIEALGLRFQVLAVPGHTAGHIAYFCEAVNGSPVLFCGDTLFSAGCGRLFEGSPAQMYHSLGQLAALPGPTRVCCAHEYTLSNLRFAAAVEPANRAILDYTQRCTQLRAHAVPTLPSDIATERQVNPFLRCDEPAVQQAAASRGANPTDPIDVLRALREWKNQF
jgi:hydroxyacylglutathione hydrolase